MEQPKTSIIILAYKEPEKFKKMFETLLAHTHQKRTPFEIIIIDNDCDPNIREYIDEAFDIYKEYELHLIRFGKNLGTSKGFNFGANESSGHYLCFFNSDYYMMDNWLESMIDCFKHKPRIGIVSCSTNISGNVDERLQFKSKTKDNIPIGTLKKDYKESDCAIAQMFTTKKIWKEVDGFSEEFFFGCEDLDFNEKIKEKGYKIFVNRKTFGFHDHDAKIKALDEGHKQMGTSREIFNKKWGNKFPWA